MLLVITVTAGGVMLTGLIPNAHSLGTLYQVSIYTQNGTIYLSQKVTSLVLNQDGVFWLCSNSNTANCQIVVPDININFVVAPGGSSPAYYPIAQNLLGAHAYTATVGGVAADPTIYIVSSAVVGGTIVPTNKLGLVLPFIGLALIALTAMVLVSIHLKRAKSEKRNHDHTSPLLPL
jgi:hypothetical protein